MLKIGELARRSGVSVRTLHYYDQIELLRPSHHTDGGHRLYSSVDVARLQQIRSLQQLGLSLAAIGRVLDDPAASLPQVIEHHLDLVTRKAALLERLRSRLENLRRVLESSRAPSVQQLIEALEASAMFEKYYTPRQLKQLEERSRIVGAERIAAAQKEWAEIFAEFARLHAEGAGPEDSRAQALAARSEALIEEFTGGDPEIRRSLANMYREEGAAAVLEPHGLGVEKGAWGLMQEAARLRSSGPS